MSEFQLSKKMYSVSVDFIVFSLKSCSCQKHVSLLIVPYGVFTCYHNCALLLEKYSIHQTSLHSENWSRGSMTSVSIPHKSMIVISKQFNIHTFLCNRLGKWQLSSYGVFCLLHLKKFIQLFHLMIRLLSKVDCCWLFSWKRSPVWGKKSVTSSLNWPGT